MARAPSWQRYQYVGVYLFIAVLWTFIAVATWNVVIGIVAGIVWGIPLGAHIVVRQIIASRDRLSEILR